MLIQIQTPLIKKRKWAIINKLIKIMSNEKKTTLEAMLAQYESATTETKTNITVIGRETGATFNIPITVKADPSKL